MSSSGNFAWTSLTGESVKKVLKLHMHTMYKHCIPSSSTYTLLPKMKAIPLPSTLLPTIVKLWTVYARGRVGVGVDRIKSILSRFLY